MEQQILTAVVIVATVIIYFKWSFSYWKRKKVVHLKPSIPFGNLNEVVFGRVPFAHTFQKLYNTFKINGNAKYAGFYIFLKPIWVVFDLDLVKSILVNDFDHFVDRSFYMDKKSEPMSAHLFSLKGNEWKVLREKFTNMYTSSKIRTMFSIFDDVANNFVNVLEDFCHRNESFDIKDLTVKYTIDNIASCNFGIEVNSFKNYDTPFKKFSEEILGRKSTLRTLYLTLATFTPNLLKILRIKFFPRRVKNYFSKLVVETIEYRERNNIKRTDFLNLMMQLRKSKSNPDGLTLQEIIGQSSLFFIAGYDNASTTLTFLLLELAANQTFQNRARTEISAILSRQDQKITFDSLKEMTFLDSCIQETLRLYPPLPNLFRECTRTYKIPNGSHTIKKGDLVYVPITDIHRDPHFYSNPNEFNPDRFTKQNSTLRHTCAWLPFGEGPRNCIGMTVGKIQVKVALAKILKRFKISLNPKTRYPPIIDPKGYLLTVLDGVWLNAEILDTVS